jgi:hypothetical protein
MDFLEIDALVTGILNSDSAVKQDLGRRFALRLGLEPGNVGADGGVDGWGMVNQRRIYFQCKLYRKRLDASFVADFCGNLVIHRADVGVLLSGVGCTSGYESRLQLFHEGLQEFAGGVTAQTLTTHLLSLEDVFAETQAFATAQLDLPDLRDLRD